MREFRGKAAIAVGVLYVGFVGWSLYGAIWPVETYAFRMIHMAFIFGLAFIVYPIRQNAGRWTLWVDLPLALLGIAAIAYAFIDTDQFIRRSTLAGAFGSPFRHRCDPPPPGNLPPHRRQHLHPGRRGIPGLHVFRELFPGYHFP